jgi:hypothetical protein
MTNVSGCGGTSGRTLIPGQAKVRKAGFVHLEPCRCYWNCFPQKELATKKSQNAASVYVELWARHMGDGLIEMKHEGEHAYFAGYEGSRAVRTWQERMAFLEQHGFIKTKPRGNQRYGYVLLVHPTAVVQNLRDLGKVSDHLWEEYSRRQLETGEASYAERKESSSHKGLKVVTSSTKSQSGVHQVTRATRSSA